MSYRALGKSSQKELLSSMYMIHHDHHRRVLNWLQTPSSSKCPRGVGILDSDFIKLEVIDTEQGAPSFLIIMTIGADQALLFGSICQPAIISEMPFSSAFTLETSIQQGAVYQ